MRDMVSLFAMSNGSIDEHGWRAGAVIATLALLISAAAVILGAALGVALSVALQ